MKDNWWDNEIADYIDRRGLDPEVARTWTIMRWLYHGNLRPLAASIAEGHALHPAVLNLLADMIADLGLSDLTPAFKVTVEKLGPGARKKLDAYWRDLAAAQAYEAYDGPSNEAFEKIADALGIGEKAVRLAVTKDRKRKANSVEE
jgi:hypothetical protein